MWRLLRVGCESRRVLDGPRALCIRVVTSLERWRRDAGHFLRCDVAALSHEPTADREASLPPRFEGVDIGEVL